MFTVVITEKGGSQRTLEFDRPEITIGRVQGNDIILPKGNVSKKHSRIVLKDGRFIVVDLKSTNGTYVNGRKITSPLVVKSTDKIYIGDFILTVEEPGGYAGAAEEAAPASEPPPPPAPQPTLDRRPPPLRPAAAPGAGLPSIARPTMRGFENSPGAPPPIPPRGEAPPARPVLASQPPPPAPPERFALDEDPSDESVPPRPRIAERGGPARPTTPPPPSTGLDADADEMTPVPASSRAYNAPPAYAAPQPAYNAPQPAYAPHPAYNAPPSAPQSAPHTAPQPAPYAPPPAYAAPQPAPQPAPHAPYTSSTATLPPQTPAAAAAATGRLARPLTARGVPQAALRALVARASQSFDAHATEPRALGEEQRWRDAQGAIDAGLAALGHDAALEGVDREALGSAALREFVGLGALDGLLGEAGVREILVEGPGRVLVDVGDGLTPSALAFSSHDAVRTIARRILARVGDDLDASRPVSEARVGDAWSAHIVGAPVVAQGALLSLTRIDRRPVSAAALVERGVLGAAEFERLRAAIAARRSVLVSGPGGVTQLLGALAGLIGPQERLVVVEDVAGLAVDHEHAIVLQAGGAGSTVTLRDVLREAERLRPDRLVVDDVRGAEAYDVLVAMAARRGRVLAGVHASSPDDALRHLELLACLDGRAQAAGAHALIRAAVQVVVQLAPTADGVSYRVAAIEDVR